MSSTPFVVDLYLTDQRPDEAAVLSKWTPLLELDAVNQANLACLSCAAGHVQVFAKLLSECPSPSARGHLIAAALRFAPSVWVDEHPFGGANWQRRLQTVWPDWSADLLSVDPARHSGWDVFLWSCFVGEDDNADYQRWALNYVARSFENKPELLDNWKGAVVGEATSKLDVWCWLLAGIPNPDRLQQMMFLLSQGANPNGVMRLQAGGFLSVGSAWIKASSGLGAGHFDPCQESGLFASLEQLPSLPKWSQKTKTDIAKLYEGDEWFECLFGGLKMLMSSGMQIESLQHPEPWPRPLLAQLANAGLDEEHWTIFQANKRLPKMAKMGLANCSSGDQVCLLDVCASWTRSQGGWYAGDVDLKGLPDTMWDTMPQASWGKLIRSEGIYGFLHATPAVLNYLMSCVLVQVPFPFDNDEVSRLNGVFAHPPTEEKQATLERLLLLHIEKTLSPQEASNLLVRFCLFRHEKDLFVLKDKQKALLLSLSHRLSLKKSEENFIVSAKEALLLSKCIAGQTDLERRLQSLQVVASPEEPQLTLAALDDTDLDDTDLDDTGLDDTGLDDTDLDDIDALDCVSPKEKNQEETEVATGALSSASLRQIEEMIRRAMQDKLKTGSAPEAIAAVIPPTFSEMDAYCIKAEQNNDASDRRPCHVLYSVDDLVKFSEWAASRKEHDETGMWKKRLVPSDPQSQELMAKEDFRRYRIKRLALAKPAMEAIEDLRRGFPHFEDVIQEISDHLLLVSRGDKAFSLPPMLMVGPPGTGKTFFFEELAKRVETTYRVLNMESIGAGFSIVGMDTGWSNAAPGFIFDTIMKPEATINPILLLDEIDKARNDSNSPVGPVLLPLLENHTARRFHDQCIRLQIDISRINWVATANVLEKIDAPLRSRFNVVPVANPDYYARLAMAGHIYTALRNRNSWGPSFIEKMSEETLQTLARPANAARELRKSITRAFASAARSQRNELLPQDIPVTETAPIHYFWDAPLQEVGDQGELQTQE